MERLTEQNSPPLPLPLQHTLTQTVASAAAALEKTELMTLWAGQSARLSHCNEASELLNTLLADVTYCLSKLMRTDFTAAGAAERRRDAS